MQTFNKFSELLEANTSPQTTNKLNEYIPYDRRVFKTFNELADNVFIENQPHTRTTDGKFFLDLKFEYLPISQEQKEDVRRRTSPVVNPPNSWAAKIPAEYRESFARVGSGDWIVSPNSLHFDVQESSGDVDLIIPDGWANRCDLIEETPDGKTKVLVVDGVVQKDPLE